MSAYHTSTTNLEIAKQECDETIRPKDEIKNVTLEGVETIKDSKDKPKEVYVHKAFLVENVRATLEDLRIHDLENIWLTDESFNENVKRFYTAFLSVCSEALKRLKENENTAPCIADSVLIAFHVVCHLSIKSVKELTKRCTASCCHVVANNEDYLKFICVLLNPDNRGFLEWSKRKVFTKWFDLKRKIVIEFLEERKNENKKNEEKIHLFESCLEILGCHKRKVLKYEPVTSDTISQRVFLFPKNVEIPVGSDGNIYEGGRDPPGQRSVYIPPGDVAKETYRLSTFMKFPLEVPVNPRDLAGVGFFYTGYKDRVKCFSCGFCVENWTVVDDVSSPAWHQSTCPMMLQEESGNIPIGGGLFAKLKPKPTASHQVRGNENGEASAFPLASTPTHGRGTPAGQLLLPLNGGSSSSTALRQTAKPVVALPSQNQTPPLTRTTFASMPSARHEIFVKSLDLRRESDRLKTFDTWPMEAGTVQPNELTRSGFFYLGNHDRVQCFSCGGVLRNWKYSDVVDEEHQKHFPGCRMMNKTEGTNVPLSANGSFTTQPSLRSPTDLSESEKRNLEAMFPCLYPANPHLGNEQVRLETFDHRWPRSRVNATPRQISKAGFFFLGERDKVKCWYCNGGLQNWDPNDEPWTEHAKWFPSCEFLIQQRGPEFVHRIVALFPTLRRPVLRGPHDVSPHFSQTQVLRTHQQRPSSPPPPMIDPKVELQRKKKELGKAIEHPITKLALEMGFTRKSVRKVLKMRFEEGNDMYNNLPDLVDDLTIHDNMAESSDEESETLQTETNNTVAFSRTGSETPTLQLPGAEEIRGVAAAATPMHVDVSLSEGMPPSMVAKIQELQDERKCKICLDKKADVVFIPCGHLCSCTSCAASLRKCPICREKITKQMRTYIS